MSGQSCLLLSFESSLSLPLCFLYCDLSCSHTCAVSTALSFMKNISISEQLLSIIGKRGHWGLKESQHYPLPLSVLVRELRV